MNMTFDLGLFQNVYNFLLEFSKQISVESFDISRISLEKNNV